MGAIAAPILEGKLEDWESFIGELNGPRKAEFDDMNDRLGLTEHRAFLQRSPDGSLTVIAVHDGPGADEFMGKVATSEHEFDAWFRDRVSDVHGIDFSGAMPPPAERRL